MNAKPMPNCPQCGTPLPPSAPDGLCPRCLMALNLKTETQLSGEAPPAQPPLPPEDIAPHFPQLEILECLGRGGMGVVYKARQKSLNRFVALKLLAPERINHPEFAGRFAREAQALAALNHPNIVTIYDFGQAGGFYYLLMEFVDGVNLRHMLRARKFTPEEALVIVPPLCDALQFAHERGIVHRDIKPENILLDKSGRVKVADFGIAKMLGHGAGEPGEPAAAPANATHSALGTPGYIAPEQQADPRRVDSRADIYSLGVVFYEMLTGELPGKRLEPPSHRVQIDVRLDEIVLRALEQKPELRYQQASVLKTQVETIAQSPTGGNPALPASKDYTAPWSQGLVLMSLVCTCVCLWPAFKIFTTGGLASNWIGASLVALIFGCALFAIRGYTLTAQALLIHRPFWITRLPLAGLQSVRFEPGILQWGIRYGNGGFFSFTGWRYNRALGTHRVFVTNQYRTVVLRYVHHTVVVSPGDPEAFVRDLNELLKRPDRAHSTSVVAGSRFSLTAVTAALCHGLAVCLYWRSTILLEYWNGTGNRLPVPNMVLGFSRSLPLILSLFAAGTLLGWVAISQIRRSEGKIRGQWLASVAGLLFPLLALSLWGGNALSHHRTAQVPVTAQFDVQAFLVNGAAVEQLPAVKPYVSGTNTNSGLLQVNLSPAACLRLRTEAKANGSPFARQAQDISWWPRVAGPFLHLMETNFLLQGGVQASAGSFLGIRRLGNDLEARIDYTISGVFTKTNRTVLPETVKQFKVDLLYEGPAPRTNVLAFLLPVSDAGGTTNFLMLGFQTTCGELLPPVSLAAYSTNRQEVFYAHDGTNVYYVIYATGSSGSNAGRRANPQSGTWATLGEIKFDDGRTFPFVQESDQAGCLNIGAQSYNLHDGVLLVLDENGSIQQRPVFPDLATVRNFDALTRLAGTVQDGTSALPAEHSASATNGRHPNSLTH